MTDESCGGCRLFCQKKRKEGKRRGVEVSKGRRGGEMEGLRESEEEKEMGKGEEKEYVCHTATTSVGQDALIRVHRDHQFWHCSQAMSEEGRVA